MGPGRKVQYVLYMHLNSFRESLMLLVGGQGTILEDLLFNTFIRQSA